MHHDGNRNGKPVFFCMSLLLQRLQDALIEGHSLVIQTGGEEWHGRVTQLDEDCVELLCCTSYGDDGNSKAIGKNQSWVIRIDRIDAVALPCEVWDARRLNEIPTIVEGEIL